MVDKPIFELAGEPGAIAYVTESSDDSSTLGYYLCSGPVKLPGEEESQNRYFNLNFTGTPGTASSIYFALMFQLPKWGWRVEKADEWIEVSPTHKEYYERTVTNKQMLESTIKTGLANAAQSVADYELMSHDVRKYQEILTYFEKGDEHLLRSMFIDQVDIHTDLSGQPISLRSIVSKWPTIIADFIRLTDEDTDPGKIADKIDVSKAEGVILATKNKLYKQWKDMFGNAAKERYQFLKGLVKARKKSIEEYREWLKPYIARFKMTKIGAERSGVRPRALRSFSDITGMSSFANEIRVFAWKPMRFAEHRKPASEVLGKFVLNPYDSYVREKLILGKNGLASIYPWLKAPIKYCPKCKNYMSAGAKKCENKDCGSIRLEDKFYVDELVNKEILPYWSVAYLGVVPQELYYMFLDIRITRLGTRIQTGELEDITFYTKIFVLSQNVLLVKILELKCRDLELEKYIDEMLGIKFEDRDIKDLVEEEFPKFFNKSEQKLSGLQEYTMGLRKTVDTYTEFFDKVKLPKSEKLSFVKRGPYERDFKERITKHFLKYAAVQLASVSDFIKEKMGVE